MPFSFFGQRRAPPETQVLLEHDVSAALTITSHVFVRLPRSQDSACFGDAAA